MELSAIVIVALGILFFFGGPAWPEIRSRISKRPAGLDAKPRQPNDFTTAAWRAVNRRVTRSE